MATARTLHAPSPPAWQETGGGSRIPESACRQACAPHHKTSRPRGGGCCPTAAALSTPPLPPPPPPPPRLVPPGTCATSAPPRGHPPLCADRDAASSVGRPLRPRAAARESTPDSGRPAARTQPRAAARAPRVDPPPPRASTVGGSPPRPPAAARAAPRRAHTTRRARQPPAARIVAGAQGGGGGGGTRWVPGWRRAQPRTKRPRLLCRSRRGGPPRSTRRTAVGRRG